MKEFDAIIGYTAVKRELEQIADVLKNASPYEKLGVAPPRGLMLHGEPGVGKTLMAKALVKASGRKYFVCRKDQPNGDFIKAIKKTFDQAAAEAPSIVFLDDMDKFSNGDERRPDAEEYVTVQSCIDENRDKDVFVLATANNLRCLPRSLLRAGRFDRNIQIDAPHGEDAERITAYYLSQKKFVSDVDAQAIARIMDGRSCAELETVINEAGLYAGLERSESITMKHFMKACMKTIFNMPESEPSEEDDCLSNLCDTDSIFSQIRYHEAGHAVVHELLFPGSVTLVSVRGSGGHIGGFTSYYDNPRVHPAYRTKGKIIAFLGGMAATEQVYGVHDWGASRDLDRVFEIIRKLVVNDCICGFHLHFSRHRDSEELIARQEQAIAVEVEKAFRKAKEILVGNREFLDAIAAELTQKEFLTALDVKRIKAECHIAPASIGSI